MERFLDRHKDEIFGTLSGYDRVLFRGSLRSISYVKGMEIFLSSQHVLFKDFNQYVPTLSAKLKQHAKEYADQNGRPFQFLALAKQSKEEYVRQIIERDQLTDGLVCVLSCVEPCQTWSVVKNAATKHLGLRSQQRQCLFLYYYFLDREFGLLHVRLETWLPFTIQVCINGREYLARQLDRAGIKYEKHDNCFTQIDDLARAQKLMNQLDSYAWPKFLNLLAKRVNPLLFGKGKLPLKGYYWSIRQGEYATDILFRDQASLGAIYPSLVKHAIEGFNSDDVLRFLGRRTNSSFSGRNDSTMKKRVEGSRVKHFVEENSIKMYDKAGSVLRIETTINNPRRFRVRRTATRNGKKVKAWLPMRKGVIDARRRCEISQAANQRYLDALAVVGVEKASYRLLDKVSKGVEEGGRKHRPLHLISQKDSKVCQVMMRGEFRLQGFRNVDLRTSLDSQTGSEPKERKRSAGRITRLLRLWTVHKLIYKVANTNYYRITKMGEEIMATALKFRQDDVMILAT